MPDYDWYYGKPPYSAPKKNDSKAYWKIRAEAAERREAIALESWGVGLKRRAALRAKLAKAEEALTLLLDMENKGYVSFCGSTSTDSLIADTLAAIRQSPDATPADTPQSPGCDTRCETCDGSGWIEVEALNEPPEKWKCPGCRKETL